MQIGGLHSCALFFLDFGYKWGFWCLLLQRRSWWSQGGTSISTFKTEKWRWIKNANSQGSIIWFGGISTKELLVFPHIHHPQTFSNKPNTNFFPSGATSLTSPLQTLLASTVHEKVVSVFSVQNKEALINQVITSCVQHLQRKWTLGGPLEDDDSLTSAQVWFHSSFAHFKKSERRSKHKRFWPVCRRSSCNTILWKRSISRMKVSRGGVLSITKQRLLGQLQPCPHRRAKNSSAKVPFGSVKTTVKKELHFLYRESNGVISDPKWSSANLYHHSYKFLQKSPSFPEKLSQLRKVTQNLSARWKVFDKISLTLVSWQQPHNCNGSAQRYAAMVVAWYPGSILWVP